MPVSVVVVVVGDEFSKVGTNPRVPRQMVIILVAFELVCKYSWINMLKHFLSHWCSVISLVLVVLFLRKGLACLSLS